MSPDYANFECVMALLRQRLGVPPRTPAPWSAAEPEGIVAVASAHFVLPALSGPAAALDAPMPVDLRAFLAEVERTNAARNAMLRGALAQITTALEATGVTPLVLKGGAFLADTEAGDAAWRFMSDLDLLVHPEHLEACISAVRALGFLPTDAHYDPEREAHYPPLVSRCGTYCIELHTRLFAVHTIAISNHALLAGAPGAPIAGARPLTPSPSHRVAHLIAHAQIHNRFFTMRRIVLRDLLDLGYLIGAHEREIDWCSVLHAFPEARDRDAALAFLAAWQQITGRTLPVPVAARHRHWAKVSLARLPRTRWMRRLQHVADTVRAEAIRLATERNHVKRRFALLEPGQLARTLAMRRHKTAQKLWG